MAGTSVRDSSWKPAPTWTAALKLVDLVKAPARQPLFEKKKLTVEQAEELRVDAVAMRNAARLAGRGLQGQQAATKVLVAECEAAAYWVGRMREALRRGNVSSGARKKAGVGKDVKVERSSTVENALASLVDAAGDPAFAAEIDLAGFGEDEVARATGYLARIEAFDEVQEGAKGTRKLRTSTRRGLGRLVQDGANRILGLANVIYVDDRDTLKLFTDCLPRSAGGTGREVSEESGPSAPK